MSVPKEIKLIDVVPMERTTLVIESASANLFTIAYRREGAESIILLHGGPGVPMDFSPISEQLSPAYQVIAFDPRGTGRSPVKAADYSMDDHLWTERHIRAKPTKPPEALSRSKPEGVQKFRPHCMETQPREICRNTGRVL